MFVESVLKEREREKERERDSGFRGHGDQQNVLVSMPIPPDCCCECD